MMLIIAQSTGYLEPSIGLDRFDPYGKFSDPTFPY